MHSRQGLPILLEMPVILPDLQDITIYMKVRGGGLLLAGPGVGERIIIIVMVISMAGIVELNPIMPI